MSRGQAPGPVQKSRFEAPTAPPPARRPPELDQVEAEIEAKEEALSELERRLAEDWGNVDLVAAHRATRDQLTHLFERWEALFEQAQA